MKQIHLFFSVALLGLLVAACSPPDDVPGGDAPGTGVPDGIGPGGSASGDGCSSDNDCTRGGCSGTICQSRSEEPVISTCEWLPEYACYQQITCGCVKGSCVWEKTKAFDQCVKEKMESSEGPVV